MIELRDDLVHKAMQKAEVFSYFITIVYTAFCTENY